MRRSTLWSWGLAGATMLAVGGMAAGQTVITQWNCNITTSAPLPPAASTGAGTWTLIGSAQSANSGAFAVGTGSSDAGAPNNAYNTSNYPAVSADNGTAGVAFAVSTVNYTGISVNYDSRHSAGSSRWTKFQYSTDGGTTWSAGTVFQQTASANFQTPLPSRTIDLSADPAANNNPNFQFRIVSVFSPLAFTANAVNYAADTAYQPTGTGATQAYISGQTDSPNFGGTHRYDMVTVKGTSTLPTPPVIGLTASSPPALCPGGTTRLTVPVAPGTTPTSTGIVVTANLSTIGGSAAQLLYDDGSNGDLVALDGTYSYLATVPANTSAGTKVFAVHVVDDQARTADGSVSLGVGNCTNNANSSVVISQVYGGGGNTGASFNADFVELFNRSGTTVDLTGWSVQYAAQTAVGGFTDANGKVALSGTINPGRYVLVQMSVASATVGAALPTPDFSATLPAFSGMAATAGRVALCSANTLIGANCADPSVKDFVGYSPGTICSEGAGPTAVLGNDLSAHRKGDGTNYYGCQDSDENFNDFAVFNPSPRNSATAANPCPVVGPDCFTHGPNTGDGACSIPTGTNQMHTRPQNAGHAARGGSDGAADATQCVGDWDGDGCVAPADVAGFVGAWFYSASNPPNLDGDIDCSGVADPADVAGFVTRWFNGLTSPASEGCV